MKAHVEFEALGELPFRWQWKSLRSLTEEPHQDIVDGPFGSNLKASEYVDRGVPIARLQNVDRNRFLDKNIRCVTEQKASDLTRHSFEPGDILLTKLGDPLGKACIAPASIGRGVIVADLVRIRPSAALVDRKYLTYAINSPAVIRHFQGHTKGTTRPRVNLGVVRELPIPIAPRDQQESIVAEIEKQFSRVDEAVANLNRVKANLKRYKAAVLKAAVEGRLVPTEAEVARREGRSYETGAELLQRVLEARRIRWSARAKYSVPLDPDTTDTHPLPDGWLWASAEQLSDFITKGTTPAAAKLFEDTGAVQFLKVYNLTFDGSLNYGYKPAFVDRETHVRELARSKLRSGDVLINIVGPPLGQVSIVPECLTEGNINQAIARFRPIEPISAKFLALMLMSEDIMKWAIHRAKTTAGQANLTLELCRALPVPLPPLAEQYRIVAEVDRRLSILREVEAEVDANLKRAARLKDVVLRQAFSDSPTQ